MFWPELLFQYTYTIFVTILYLIDKMTYVLKWINFIDQQLHIFQIYTSL